MHYPIETMSIDKYTQNAQAPIETMSIDNHTQYAQAPNISVLKGEKNPIRKNSYH